MSKLKKRLIVITKTMIPYLNFLHMNPTCNKLNVPFKICKRFQLRLKFSIVWGMFSNSFLDRLLLDLTVAACHVQDYKDPSLSPYLSHHYLKTKLLKYCFQLCFYLYKLYLCSIFISMYYILTILWWTSSWQCFNEHISFQLIMFYFRFNEVTTSAVLLQKELWIIILMMNTFQRKFLNQN